MSLIVTAPPKKKELCVGGQQPKICLGDCNKELAAWLPLIVRNVLKLITDYSYALNCPSFSKWDLMTVVP